jgi:t-SNARE complex subunit (syntaxin)
MAAIGAAAAGVATENGILAFATQAMLPSMILSGMINGGINMSKYNESCKAVDKAKNSLEETTDKWQNLLKDQALTLEKIQDAKKDLLNSISGLKAATAVAEKEYKEQIRSTEILLAIMIFLIIVLLTIKRFRIIQKIIEIFK